MKALITGSHGFLGTHLADELAERGVDVFAFPRALFLDVEEATKFIDKIKPDYIYHLAAYGNMSNQKDEAQMIASNVLGTFSLLEASRLLPYSAFVYVSTSSVYGTKEKPMKEIDVCDTDTYYGVTKLSGEYLCKAFAKKHNKPITILRPFSIYGPNEASFRFIPTVIKKIKDEEVLELESRTNHDWLYVKDFVKAVTLVSGKIQQTRGKIINVGTGNQYTNMEVVRKIEEIMDKEASIQESLNMREFEVSSWVADNTVMRSFGWKPKYDLVSGLKETINVNNKQKP